MNMENGYEVITIVIVLIFALIGIGIGVMFLLTIQNALKEVGESRRKIAPSNVWLMFIPLFNIRIIIM